VTPLRFAYQNGFTKIIDYLVKKGAKHGFAPKMLHPFKTYSDALRLLPR
jgi:hypothetical protein